MRKGLGFHNRHSAGGFSPASLFAGGVQGAWYDPSDLTTLFQDSAGTTPVTAVEQPVGLILDKSGRGNHAYQSTSASRPTLRARYNLLTYSEQFDNAAWTKQASSVSANSAVAPDGTTTADKLIENATTNIHYVSAAGQALNGTYVLSVYAKAAERSFVYLDMDDSGGGGTFSGAGYFDLVNGTASARSGATVAISAVGNGWYRCSVTATGNATATPWIAVSDQAYAGFPNYAGNGTSGIYIWGAQLVPTAVFPSNTYQRVGAATDYATGAAFPPYLAFDGVDDSLLTNSVDFATVTSDGQARRNLLTNPTQFDVTTSWSVISLSVTANNTTAPDGTSTAELITLGAGTANKVILQAVSSFSGARTYSFYAKYGTNRFVQLLNNGTVEGFANFDIQNGVVGTTGSGVTSSISDAGSGWWRCVVTHAIAAASDFRIYGVDSNSAGWDSTTTSTGTYFLWGAQLETGSTATAFQNIGTDQMNVAAGVTKNSDAAQGAVAELSATIASNNGAFLLSAPNSAAANYNFSSKGTTQVDNTVTTYAAPRVNVLTGVADVAAPSNVIRVNGVQAGSVTTTQGTGNFGNYPLYIGRRNNATLPFNGNIYSLVIAGAAYSAAQISSTESWVAAKTPLGTI